MTASRPAGSAIAFGFGGQLESLQRETTFDLAFRLQENRWNGTVSPQLVVRRILEGEPRYHELRSWLLEEWARGEDGWSPEARAIFGELGLDGNEPTSLYESETFRALLAEGESLARAA